jgi:nitrous oxidase accessory protein NosD
MKRRDFVRSLALIPVSPLIGAAAARQVDVVARYGVRNDGAEPASGPSNSSRIGSALTDLARADGGTLVFPAGTYHLTSGLTIPGDRITIAGEGRATIFDPRFSQGSVDFVWSCVSRRDVIFRDFVVRGSHSGAMRIHGSRGCRILSCDVSGATRVNSQGFCAGIYVSDVDDLVVDDCTLTSNGRGRVPGVENDCDLCANMGSEQIRASRITNNRCTSRTVHSNIALFDPYDVVVSGNVASGAIVSQKAPDKQGYGILLYHTATVPRARRGLCRVMENHVSDTEGTGIFLQAIPDSSVTHNVVARAGSVQEDSALAVAGILVEGVLDSLDLYGTGAGERVGRQLVADNQVSDCTRAGISLSSTTATVCRGNLVDRCRYGISIRGAVADLQIEGNIVTSVRPSGEGAGIGQWSDAPAARVRLIGNVVRGVPAAAVGIWARSNSSDWTLIDNDVSQVVRGTPYVLAGGGHALANNRSEGRPFGPPRKPDEKS